MQGQSPASASLDPSNTIATPLAIALVLFVVATYALGLSVRSRVQDNADFVVAGRRLPLSLAWATLLATWFGAGTLLTSADEVRRTGLRAAALEPFGAGLCLVIAGLVLAKPMWEMKLLTLSDFYARMFGRRAEVVSAFVMVPSYFGWIAVQFLAVAAILELFFQIPPVQGLLLVAVLAMGYTMIGGMWAVTMTDAMQLVILAVGLVTLGGVVLFDLGDGSLAGAATRLGNELPPGHLVFVPTENARELVGWLGVLTISAIGNLPGQDLMQRIFAARTATVARQACLIAGVLYCLLGAIPVLMGLAAALVVDGDTDRAILPALAGMFLSPPLAVMFVLAVVAAVASTISSALLSPATVLSQNLLLPLVGGRIHELTLNRICVALVTVIAVVVALAGESMYQLLEDAYALGLVGLAAPLLIPRVRTPRREVAALLSMVVGVAVWGVHFVADWDDLGGPALGIPFPRELAAFAASIVAYLLADLGPAPVGGPTDSDSMNPDPPQPANRRTTDLATERAATSVTE
jgi:SSS family solute:Na+ symporter